MDNYMAYLAELIPERDCLKLVRSEAQKYSKTHTPEECYQTGLELYRSDNFQVQEVGVFLLGYAAHACEGALAFLKNEVSRHPSWKVQETLAVAFDNHCKIIGYETALPLIKEWFSSDCANVRRAVSEGLRKWTSRPYFQENPQAAIDLLSAHRADESEYVRKSIGNALKDISKKLPELVLRELDTWDLSTRAVRQVHRLARKLIDKSSPGAAETGKSV